jgi:hypothetical protein
MAQPQLVRFIEGGRLVRELPTPQEIRKYVLSQLGGLDFEQPH